MRLFLHLVLIWTAASLLIGFLGYAWLKSAWLREQEAAFRKVAVAAVATVEARQWNAPAEDSPEWAELQESLGVGLIPLVAANSVDEASFMEDLGASRVLREPPADAADSITGGSSEIQIGRIRSQAAGSSGQRLFIELPLSSTSVDANRIRVTQELGRSPVRAAWWLQCGVLTVTTYVLGLVGWFFLYRESWQRRRLLRPWFRALESVGQRKRLLPRVEPQDSDFCLQMDAVSRTINQVYSDLKNANDRSELVLGNLREGVLAVDDRFRILLANKAMHRLLDLPDENYLLRPLLEVIRTPAIARLTEKVLREQTATEEQIEFGTAPKHLRILAKPLSLGSQRTGALVTIRDETMIRRVDLIKRDFVANASHELKTPLAAIRAYAETLQLGALEDPEMAESFIGNIIAQADRMDGLVQGMLQLSRVEVGSALKFKLFDAVEAIESCVAAAQAVARSKGVQINVDVPSIKILLRSDRDGFQTIASNLLSNGVRYTESDGSVSVSLREDASSVVLEVVDTGIGMRPDDLERVFERFYRAEKDRSSHTGGTGLGLSIVKHLTQALGGTVQATSEVGLGSTFTVQLPKQPAADSDASHPLPQAAAR